MKATIQNVAVLALMCVVMSPVDLLGQDNIWTGGVGGEWSDSTWNFGTPPVPDFDARGIVGSDEGSASPIGEVNVTMDIRTILPSSTVVLGDGAGNMGTLNISANGGLAVVSGAGSGHFEVGLDGGTGILNLSGILEIEGRLSSATEANANSAINLSGSATLTAASGFIDHTFVVDGSSVSASFTNELTLGQGGTHTWRIPATGASTVSVGGNLDLGGTLKVDFPDGAPAVGSSWNLIDSAQVDNLETPKSGFNNVDSSSVPLGVGQTFVVQSIPDGGSTNGIYTKLQLEQHPVLVVDRGTGAVSLQNPGSGPSIDFDLYTITSESGSLNQGGWNSIAPDSNWVEANPSSNALSELNTGSSVNIGAGGNINLGNAFSATVPAYFGQETEDVRFRFGRPGESTFTEGAVIYTGVPTNTLTLNVDPNTGEAQIINGTPFTVEIDVYQILSASGSLEAGNSDWSSLDDQGTDWQEANAGETQLAELLPAGGMVIAPNEMIPLGSPFDNGDGAQDLEFQFALVSDGLGEAGDFDDDGDRDGNDFLEWQRGNSPADGSAEDLADWESGYGVPVVPTRSLLTGKVLYSPLVSLGSIGAVAVPEPSALLLIAVSLPLVGGFRRSANC